MRFGILGMTRAWGAGGAVLPVGGPGRRALLALLLVDAGRPVPVERLVAGLYGEDPPEGVANAVQAQVSRLRAVLECPVERVGAGGYRIVVDAEQVDVRRFEALARAGRAALTGGQPEAALGLLAEGLALWRGPALADVREAPFAAGQVVRLEELRTAAVEDRVAAELALHRAGERTAAELRALVAEQPLRERPAELLMRTLDRLGRRGEALAVYAELRERLAEQVGGEPGAAAAAAHAALLRAPARDVSRETSARSVPRPLTGLIGRERELAEVRERLRGGRLVTLFGPGGVGKTRLAAAVAADHPGGACFVDLTAAALPEQVVPTVLSALGLREGGVRSGQAVAGPHPDPAEARLLAVLAGRGGFLLVLDNCEHLPGPVAELTERLLAGCPELRVLATSREALLIPAEVLTPLPPLEPDAAMRLFAERAQASVPPGTGWLRGLSAGGPDSADDDVRAVAEICRRLDGMPLAVELAAARLRMLTPRQIADRLDDRFHLLTSGSRTAHGRQQTLRAVVDWSWDLLPAEERTVLGRLSVFSGGCTLAAAEAVCGTGPRTLDLVGALVDKSLLAVVASSGGGEPRYRMLETIRAYAADRLAEAGRTAAEAAHTAYFLAAAEAWEPGLRTRDQLTVLAAFDADHDNLLTALRRADPLTDGLDLLALLSGYWLLRGLRTEGRGPALRLLAALEPALAEAGNHEGADADADADAEAEADVGADAEWLPGRLRGREEQYALCVVAAVSSGIDSPEVARHVARCLPIVRRLMLSHPLRNPVVVVLWAPFTGVPREEQVLGLHEQAFAVARADPWFGALLHFSLGFLHWYLRGDLAGSARAFGTALGAFEELGDRWGAMMALMELAAAAGRAGERARANAFTERGLGYAAELGSADAMAELLWSRAEVSIRAGDRTAAAADLHRAVELARPLGVSDNLARARQLLAELALAEGRLDQARQLCRQALGDRLVGWSSGEWTRAVIELTLARIETAAGRPDAALAHLREAAVIGRPEADNLPLLGEVALGLADHLLRTGSTGAAADALALAELLAPAAMGVPGLLGSAAAELGARLGADACATARRAVRGRARTGQQAAELLLELLAGL